MNNRLQFASATSDDPKIVDAVASLKAQVDEKLRGASCDLLQVFFSPSFAETAEELGRALREAIDPGLLVGCSARGVIGGREEIEEGPAISLLAGSTPGIGYRGFRIPSDRWTEILRDPGKFREMVGSAAEARLFILLADPFTTPIDDLLRLFQELYPSIPVVGGMSSGARAPGESALLFEDEVVRNGAIGVSWNGEFECDLVVSQGCRPIGQAFTVTEARENLIKSLDGVSPLESIEKLVQEIPEGDRELLRNGLFVGRSISRDKPSLSRGDFLIRGVVGIDRPSGTVEIGDRVEEGERVQFHLRDAATATEDLELMLSPHVLIGRPDAVMLFTCNGRGTRLYDHPNGDVSIIQGSLGDVPLAGCFCAGEIGPIGGRSFLHGHTASIALIRSRPTTPERI